MLAGGPDTQWMHAAWQSAAIVLSHDDAPRWGVNVKKTSSTSASRTTILAIVGTLSFYSIAPLVPGISDFVVRYFCRDFLQYVCTGMFFTGLAILIQKSLNIRTEKQTLSRISREIDNGTVDSAADPGQLHETLTLWCDTVPKAMKQSVLHNRLSSTLHYIKSSGRRGMEEHLRYLAELASDRLAQSYSTIRTVTWAIPILGFLGTVIGITMAIANLTPEQLDSSLADVTQGLGFAFDTTALALAMSIILVFAAFAVERVEQQVLNEVEQFGIECILPWFATDIGDEDHSNVLQTQNAVWTGQIAELRETWAEVLQQHAQQLSSTMADEVQRTLKMHRLSIEDTQESYSNALHTVSQTIVGQTQTVLDSFSERMGAWQAAIQQSSQDSVRQSESLHELGAVLLRMTESEERLAALQVQLNENLQSIQMASTIEESANSLTAAVHVLTAKTSRRAA